MVAAIVPGELRFQEDNGTEHILAVSNGFVEMINNRAKIFCLSAERPDEIDAHRAREAKEGQKNSFARSRAYRNIM